MRTAPTLRTRTAAPRLPRAARATVACAVLLAGCAGGGGRATAAATPPTQADRSPAPTGLLDALVRAGAADQRGDRAEVRRLLRAAYGFGPDHGQVLYFLAREEARAGDADAALRVLDRLAAQGTTRDVRADTGFAALDAPGVRVRFAATAGRLRAAAEPLVRSDTTHLLQDPDLVPEGIAYDAEGDAFYVGSLHRRSVVRIDRAGRESVFLEPGRDGLGQVLGLHVDAARRRLWLATLVLDSAAPRHSNGGAGWAFVHAYDLPGGRLVARHAAPDSTVPHLLNDLVVTRAGDLYATDTEAHAVYRLPAGGARLERFHGGEERFRYPNGIALDPAGRRLYVAHFEGISVADLGLGARAGLTALPRPAGVSGGGIDGLYACADRLVAVQALLGFQQVTAFRLATDGRAITAAEALERRHPVHDWATTGTFARGGFHYIANAQLRRLSPLGALSPPTLPGRSVVLGLRDVCGRG
jgi:sugar lactone lactonase YvrE